MINNAYKAVESVSQRSLLKSKYYDPVKDKWVDVVKEKTLEDNTTITSITEQASNSGSTDKTTSQGQADKEYKDIEIITLTGDLNVIPNNETVKIKSGDTITIKGIGKYLSGLYFVDSVSRTISNSDGYSHSFAVIKTGFGGTSLKDSSTVTQQQVNNNHNRPLQQL